MVPALDMVNHSSKATAYYDEDSDAVVLSKRSGAAAVSTGEEVTISYGDAKPAAEMLFSYGFIDAADGAPRALTLPLSTIPDDPLAKAKLHVYGTLPSVKLSQHDNAVSWESPFAYLMCLNEEDGLEFRVLQDMSGGQQLRLFWEEEDVTEHASDFDTLIQRHPLCQVFRLRTVAVLHEQVASQLERITSGPSRDDMQNLIDIGLLRETSVQQAEVLKEIETSIMAKAVHDLEQQVGT